MEYIQRVQQKFMCQRCGKPVLAGLGLYATCRCATRHKLSPKEARRSMYLQALVNTVRTARTAAHVVGSLPNPRMAGARR